MFHGETEQDRFTRVLFYAVVLAVGYLAFRVVAPFLAAMAWAAVFAMVLSPIAARIERRLGVTASAAATTVLAGLLIVVPAVFVMTVLIREVTQLATDYQQSGYSASTPVRLREAWQNLRRSVPFDLPPDLSTALSGGVRMVAAYLASTAGSVLQNVVSLVFQLFVMLSGLFFFLRDRGRVVGAVREVLPFARPRNDRVIQQTYDLVVATVGSTFAVAAIQGTLTGVALGALGFRAPVFWGVMTGIVSVIPAVGSGIVWVPAAIWLFAYGEIVKGIILVAVGVLVIGMADNVLRPIFLSGRTTMHGLLVFLSLMGGIGAFGFIGLVLGPVIVATMSTLLEAAMPAPATAPAAAHADASASAEPPDETAG